MEGILPLYALFICVQFGISYLTYEHTLWYFTKSAITPNHVVTDFLIAFTNFVPMVLLFLSRYPNQSGWAKQVLYVGAWIVTFSVIEFTFKLLGLTTFHNGWTMGWSVVVWIFIFIVLEFTIHDRFGSGSSVLAALLF